MHERALWSIRVVLTSLSFTGAEMLFLCFSVFANLTDEYPVVRGVQLRQIVENPQANDDLYQANQDGKRVRRGREQVFQMQLIARDQPDSAWLRYPPQSGRFYIDYRPNRKDSRSGKLYGPIEGDPFELMNLDQEMLEKARSDKPKSDLYYRMKLMLRTNDPGLSRRAFRLMYRMLDKDVDGYLLEQNLKQVLPMRKEFEETLAAHIRGPLMEGFAQRLEAAEEKNREADRRVPRLRIPKGR